MQRFNVEHQAGIAARLTIAMLAQCLAGEAFEGGKVKVSQPFTLVEQPIIEHIGKQITAIQFDDNRVIISASPLEGSHIKPIFAVGVPLHGDSAGHQPGLICSSGQGMA